MKITLLGCGASTGVPVIGCNCKICHSANPKNKRTRTSAIISDNNTNILIDSGIDYRAQMLQHGFCEFDGVLYTHCHQDHTHGIEDMRISGTFSSKPFQIFSTERVMQELQSRFPNSFAHHKYYHPNCVLQSNIINDYQLFKIKNIQVESILQKHGYTLSNGFIFNEKLAFCTDVSEFPTRSLDILKTKHLEYLFIVCVRWSPSYAHFNFDNMLKIVAEINPKQTVLIHMNHELDYDELLQKCPDNIVPGYDGMTINL